MDSAITVVPIRRQVMFHYVLPLVGYILMFLGLMVFFAFKWTSQFSQLNFEGHLTKSGIIFTCLIMLVRPFMKAPSEIGHCLYLELQKGVQILVVFKTRTVKLNLADIVAKRNPNGIQLKSHTGKLLLEIPKTYFSEPEYVRIDDFLRNEIAMSHNSEL
jgi:hypothetical protein